MRSDAKIFIPAGISIIRIILSPLFFLTLIYKFPLISIIILIFAVLTDLVDGYIARRMDLTSTIGAYIDVTSDFIFIIAGFFALIINGTYPFWLLFIIIVMFLQFIVTSKIRIKIYDPVGKYYGSFLFLILFITLIFTNPSIYLILTIMIVVFSVISIISRILFIIRHED